MENLYLVAGLGNPGKEYAGTRHNIGFMLADRMAKRWKVDWNIEKRFQSRVAKGSRGRGKVILVQPQTFMNSSGEAVAAIAKYFNVPLERTLVVVDDADLGLGQLRLRPSGSSGGHHGLESIEQHLATRDYPRLRLGIGRRAENGRQIANYVLSRFSETEQETVEKVLDRASDQVECWLSAGIVEAMNRFNGAISAPSNKGNE